MAADAGARIGLLLPPDEMDSVSLRRGVELAIAEATQGTAPGAYTLVVRGKPGQWGDDGEESGRLVLDDEVQGLIGPTGGAATHLLLQVAGRTAIPVVSLCGDSSVRGAGIPWLAQIVPATGEEGRVLAAYWKTQGPQTGRACVPVTPDARAGREIDHDLRMAWEGAGLELAPRLELASTAEAAEITAAAKDIVRRRSPAIMVWLPGAQAARLVAALRTSGYSGTIMGPARLQSRRFVEAAGLQTSTNVIVAGFASGTGATNSAAAVLESFAGRFNNQFQAEPDFLAAAAYDAARFILRHLEQGAESVHGRRFDKTVFSDGVMGAVQIDGSGARSVELAAMPLSQSPFVRARRSGAPARPVVRIDK